MESSGEVAKTLTLTAPANGIVLEKNVNEGQHVTPGMQLYRVADLGAVSAYGALQMDGARDDVEAGTTAEDADGYDAGL